MPREPHLAGGRGYERGRGPEGGTRCRHPLEIEATIWCWKASAPPPPIVLDLLSRHKTHVIAMLRRQARMTVVAPSRPLCASEIAERSSLIESAITPARHEKKLDGPSGGLCQQTSSVPWWECSALVGDAEWLAELSEPG